METFETRWIQARRLEADGRNAEACAAYEEILKIEPSRLYARLRLSDLLVSADRYREARLHVVRSIEDVEDGKRAADLHQVTRRLLFFGEYEHVSRLIMQAHWNQPETIASSPFLIQHLWLSGEVRSALVLCERMLAIAPEHAALNYCYGLLLNYAGHTEPAARAFDRCIKAQPDHAAAHWSLAYLLKSDMPLARVSRVEWALAANADAPDAQTFLHYALYREHENAGENDKAWRHLELGAKLKRNLLSYDGDAEDQAVQALLDYPPAKGRTITHKLRHLFIVGMPRTGTTLLERILGAHPDSVADGELTEFRDSINWCLDKFVGAKLDYEDVVRMRQVDLHELGDIYGKSVQWRMPDHESILINKHPENFMLSRFIAEALPDAKIICLRRNPMDACFSNLKELFVDESYGYSYTLSELADHYHRFHCLSHHWQKTMPDSFHLIDYEYLVTDPVASVSAIFEFCGLDFDVTYLDITRNSTPVATASAAQVRKPISAGAVGAWKRYESHLAPLKSRLESLGHAIDQ